MSFLFNSIQYFFQITPSTPFQYQTVTLIIAILLFGASIALRLFLKKHKEDKILKKLFRTVPSQLQSLAICFGIYIVARYSKIPFLSMRIINYILVALVCYVIIQNIRIYLKKYPELKKQRLEQMKLNKYLPHKKAK